MLFAFFIFYESMLIAQHCLNTADIIMSLYGVINLLCVLCYKCV